VCVCVCRHALLWIYLHSSDEVDAWAWPSCETLEPMWPNTSLASETYAAVDTERDERS
jgi:hypothetical protein